MANRTDYFRRYHEQVRKQKQHLRPIKEEQELRSSLVTLRLRDADFRFLEQLAAERRHEGIPTHNERSKRLGAPMDVEDFTVEVIESVLASERLRRSCDPQNYKTITCPNCSAQQWINKTANVDGWRCQRCLHDLTAEVIN